MQYRVSYHVVLTKLLGIRALPKESKLSSPGFGFFVGDSSLLMTSSPSFQLAKMISPPEPDNHLFFRSICRVQDIPMLTDALD